jgi:hypothetical protein
MRKLKRTYKKNGYTHNVIYYDDVYAISEVYDEEICRVICYEIFQIKKNPTRIFNNKLIEGWEGTPSNEEWGQKGWTYRTYDEAFNKLSIIKKQKNERNTKTRSNCEAITTQVDF